MLGRAVGQPPTDDLFLDPRQLGRPSGGEAAEQARLAFAPVRADPTSDRSGVDVEELGDLLGGVSFEDPLDGELAAMLQLRWWAFVSHVRECNRLAAERTFFF